ncbi:MAG: YfhO family protein [Planctomycetes bacterium]|nr:YfhO family protein [Planctomycetota bacterium]
MYVFFVISGFSLLLFANFRDTIVTSLSINQKFLMTLFPFLQPSEVLQHFGLLFIFCLIILSAVGFKEVQRRKKTGFICLVITLTIYKYLYITFLILQPKSPILKNPTVINLFIVLAVMIPVVSFLFYKKSYFSLKEEKKYFRLPLLRISLIVLFFDLLLFNLGMYLFLPGESGFISNMYTKTLKSAGVYSSSQDGAFDNFRRISVYGKSFYSTYVGNAFFGLEIYKETKTAFPNIIVGSFLNYPIPRYDHFYMTPSFYDYSVNIDLEKQAILSSICTPILQFFPDENVRFVEHKYDAVREINETLPSQLMSTLYIESEPDFHRARLSAKILFEKEYFLNYTRHDITGFINTAQKFYKKADTNISVKNHTVNFVTLEITVDSSGFLYFADGYSKHWKAFVDGARVKLYKANINFKAVSLPPGTHSVTFEYDPTLYRYSLYAFTSGNLLFIATLIFNGIYFRKEKIDECSK